MGPVVGCETDKLTHPLPPTNCRAKKCSVLFSGGLLTEKDQRSFSGWFSFAIPENLLVVSPRKLFQIPNRGCGFLLRNFASATDSHFFSSSHQIRHLPPGDSPQTSVHCTHFLLRRVSWLTVKTLSALLPPHANNTILFLESSQRLEATVTRKMQPWKPAASTWNHIATLEHPPRTLI